MPKRIAGWGMVVLALGGLCLFVFGARTLPEQSFHRADGSLVKLVSVTYGTNQIVVLGNRYQRTLYYILPKKLKKLINVSVHTFTTPVDEKTPNFWLLEKNEHDYLKVRALDEFGSEFDALAFAMSQEPVYFKRQNYDGQNLFRYQVMGIYPNGKIIGLAIYDPKGNNQKLATILAPGAVLKQLPKWKPAAATIKQVDELSFELHELVTGLQSIPFSSPFIVTNGSLFTEFVFHVTKRGEPVQDWLPADLEITDALGSRITTWNRQQQHGFKNGDPLLNLQGTLDPAGGPYKIKVTFAHASTNCVADFEATPITASGKKL
jgi:hypothetical protein